MSSAAVTDARVEELCGDLTSIRAPRGTELNARSWQTEAPLRMLLNNLDAEVAEHPEQLIVYGGSGKAARNHDALRALVRSLLELGEDESLLVQSGKPVGVFRTHPAAPRVLIANSLLVPRWATWDEFRRLEALDLTMFGQMTAGSWIYIGTQGILQGTYQTFAAAGEAHFGSPDLRGRTILTAGLGGMGGAQPLAATMAGAAMLCVEVDATRIERRLATRYLDEASTSLEDAVGRVRSAAADGRALSVGLLGNAAEVVPELVARGEAFDLVTDQTAAHDPLNGYVPVGLSVDDAADLRASDPDEYLRRASESIARHVEGMLGFVRAGSYVFDYGNNLRGRHNRQASRTLSHTRALSRPISGRSSAAASARSAGPRSRGIRTTSQRSTGRCSSSSRTTSSCSAGSSWRRTASRSRVSRRASAGSATGTVPGRASPSTSSCATGE